MDFLFFEHMLCMFVTFTAHLDVYEEFCRRLASRLHDFDTLCFVCCVPANRGKKLEGENLPFFATGVSSVIHPVSDECLVMSETS